MPAKEIEDNGMLANYLLQQAGKHPLSVVAIVGKFYAKTGKSCI
jgi:hypothetical protein